MVLFKVTSVTLRLIDQKHLVFIEIRVSLPVMPSVATVQVITLDTTKAVISNFLTMVVVRSRQRSKVFLKTVEPISLMTIREVNNIEDVRRGTSMLGSPVEPVEIFTKVTTVTKPIMLTVEMLQVTVIDIEEEVRT